MSNKMIIRLLDTPPNAENLDDKPNNPQSNLEWLILDAKGNTIREFNQTLLENTEIYILVPSSSVFLTTAKLPKLPTDQLLKALPFALGEQLSENASTLHYAIGKHLKENLLAVAVVSHGKMQQWMERINLFFKDLHPDIKKLLPEVLALPIQPNEWTVYIDRETALVRTDTQAGFEVELSQLWLIIKLLLKRDDIEKPKKIIFIGEVIFPNDAMVLLTQYNVTPEIKPYQSILNIMADALPNSGAINLLQGPYKLAYYSKKSNISYVSAVILFVALLAILTLGVLSQFLILHSQESKLNHEISMVFKKTFPNTKLTSNKQIKTLIKQVMQSGQAQKGFLQMMSHVIPDLVHAKEVRILGLQYANNQLTLAVETNDLALLDKLSQALATGNTQAELHDAVKTGSQIHANLVIQPGKN